MAGGPADQSHAEGRRVHGGGRAGSPEPVGHQPGVGNCVEVATNLAGIVAVRDSKDPAGTALTFTSTAWTPFILDVTDFPATRQPSL
ncbi:DUF397 domain-containing protein [Micromonospora echinospora]|uniref:DUF397 domain-containing protein n=1 Tax=Micromonospora echinospora TaxID=1877 RepID=UPI003671BCA9